MVIVHYRLYLLRLPCHRLANSMILVISTSNQHLTCGMVGLLSPATPFADDQQWSKDQAGGERGAGQTTLFWLGRQVFGCRRLFRGRFGRWLWWWFGGRLFRGWFGRWLWRWFRGLLRWWLRGLFWWLRGCGLLFTWRGCGRWHFG